MSKHLKPCPLCGSAPSMATDGITAIHCGCGLTLQLGTRSIVAHEEAWNRRATNNLPTPTKSVVPEGWRMVPVEPTENMLDEGHSALTDRHKTGQYGECPGLGWSDSEACYRAMIQAAPDTDVSVSGGLIDGWRPIESAPRDGTHVIIKSGDSLPTTCHWFDGGWHLSVNQLGEYSDWIWGEPTHWMPLPAAPNDGAKEKWKPETPSPYDLSEWGRRNDGAKGE